MKNVAKLYQRLIMSLLLILSLVFSLLSFDTTTCIAGGISFMRYYDGNEHIYINLKECKDKWWTNSCTHKVYFFGNDVAWTTLEETDNKNVFKALVPEGEYNKLIICRCKDKSSTWEDNGVYNQTGDIDIHNSYNYISSFQGEKSANASWENYTDTDYYVVNDDDNSKNNIDTTTDSIQGGVILHAFCWTYNVIKENMKDIAASGYTAVQTSPVQQAKDYSVLYTKLNNEWWKMYQPLSYSIATDGWLGTKQDFIAMCNEAKKYGVKVICDIVANHLAADNNDPTLLNEDIQKYEPTIYANQDTMLHPFVTCNDDSVENIVQGNVGMPDVNTSNPYIQERILSLLKECVDCGADGFRFDAAKHIETDEDGESCSDFWPNITSKIKEYGKTKNKEIYIYGEILSPMMAGRKYSSYTKHINVIDNRSGDLVLNAVLNKDANVASDSRFASGEDASKLVIWAESHDTYMGESGSSGGIKSTRKVNESLIKKAWAIVGSRTNITSLYLARPNEKIGLVGTTTWKSKDVSSVNYFHNNFRDSKEYLSNYDNVVMNERYYRKSKESGAVLVSLDEGCTKEVYNQPVYRLSDGEYTDKITNNTFIISNGRINGRIGSTGIAVLYKKY